MTFCRNHRGFQTDKLFLLFLCLNHSPYTSVPPWYHVPCTWKNSGLLITVDSKAHLILCPPDPIAAFSLLCTPNWKAGAGVRSCSSSPSTGHRRPTGNSGGVSDLLRQPGDGASSVSFHVGGCTLGDGTLILLSLCLCYSRRRTSPSRKDLWPSCEWCGQMTASNC